MTISAEAAVASFETLYEPGKLRPPRGVAEPPANAPGLDAFEWRSALRYRVDTDAMPRWQAHPLLGGPGRLGWSRQARDYYDTDAGDLAARGLALNLRRTRARRRMALQAGGRADAPFARGEAEVALAGDEPKPDALAPGLARLVAKAVEDRPLRLRFRFEARQARRIVAFEGTKFEIVFRQGEMVAGEARERVCEIEVVLSADGPAALCRFGLALARAGLTRLAAEPLQARGMRLATGARAALARAVPPDFSAEASLDEATAALLRNGLSQFLGNWPAMEGEQIGEAVHQIRVSLRRLRSALGILRPMFGSAALEALRAQAKAIADAFGEARDWDVFGEMVETGPKAAMPDVAALARLAEAATARTTGGRAKAAETLAGAATAHFVLSMQEFIATRGWRNAVGDAPALVEPALDFATRTLDRLHRRVRRRGRDFSSLAPEPRHELRIALKQLRYACDFFGPLYRPQSRVRQFAKGAAELQDILGVANDGDVAAHRIASLDLVDPAFGFAAGAVRGWCARGAHLDSRVLRKAWRGFRKCERFWRDAEGVGANGG